MTLANSYCVLVRIEGLSLSANGQQAVFCSQLPSYADANYVAWLAEFPPLLSERADPLGGNVERGAATVAILDHGDRVSALLGMNGSPVSTLLSDISATATTIVMGGAPSIPGNLVYLGAEAIQFTSTSVGGTQLDSCARGVLGTIALPHAAGASIYTLNPLLRGRTFTISLVRQDAVSSYDEVQLGEYAIEDVGLDAENLGVWRLGGTSRLRYLDRSIGAGRRLRLRVTGSSWLGVSFSTLPSVSRQEPFNSVFSDDAVSYQTESGEIVRAEYVTAGRPYLRHLERGIAGTKQDEIKAGELITECLEASDAGSFRYSPGPTPSMSKTSGTWIAAESQHDGAHFVDILLCLLTSSAHASDGLYLQNHKGDSGLYDDSSLPDEERANWSCLPIGWGLGVPADRINIASFLRVKERTPDLTFAWCAISEPAPFLRWAEEAFLRAIGAFLTLNTTQQLELVLPRLPSQGETSVALTLDNIISIDAIDWSLGSTPAIDYVFAGDRRVSYRASEIDPEFLGVFYSDLESTEIPVRYGRADPSGLHAPLMRAAQRRVLLFGRPYARVRMTIDYETGVALSVAGIVSVTHPDLPVLNATARGWDQVLATVVERVVQMPDEHPTVSITILAFTSALKAPVLSAAGRVASSVANGSDRDVTLAANLFTDASNIQGLATQDAQAFRVGDLVQERTANLGAPVGSPRAVLAKAGNVITLQGSGSPSAGNWIVGADHGDLAAIGVQANADLAMADSGLLEVSAGTSAFAYGER